MRRKLLLSLLVVGLPVLLVSSCSKHVDVWEGVPAGTQRVVVSFPPLYSFVKAVGGDHVSVICIATEKGPHEYVYNSSDLVLVAKANLLLGIGLGLDDNYAPILAKSTSNDNLHFVQLGKGLLAAGMVKKNEEAKEEKDGKEDKHDHDHGEHDPHVWLGIPHAIKMVEQIRDELTKLDKENKADYARNAEAYIKELNDLHEKGKKDLAGKKDKRLISLHDALRYFADSYGLDIVDVIEVTPGDDPGPEKLKQLTDLCLDKKIKLIAVELQYPPKAAESIEKEVENKAKKLAEKNKTYKDFKVKLIEIDPLETVKDKDQLTRDLYVETMQKNLEILKKELE